MILHTFRSISLILLTILFLNVIFTEPINSVLIFNIVFIAAWSLLFIFCESFLTANKNDSNLIHIDKILVQKMLYGGLFIFFFIIDIFFFHEIVTMHVLALCYIMVIMVDLNQSKTSINENGNSEIKTDIIDNGNSEEWSISIDIQAVDSRTLTKEIIAHLNHNHVKLSGLQILKGEISPFVLGFNVDLKVDLSEATYAVYSSKILIKAPKKKSDIISGIGVIKSCLGTKEAPIKNNYLDELSLINESFSKNVVTLNNLIEEVFFEGSTIKEQIKKDINELVDIYIMVDKYQKISSTKKLIEQKEMIENKVKFLISFLIDKKSEKIDIEQKFNNIQSNFELYFNINNQKGS